MTQNTSLAHEKLISLMEKEIDQAAALNSALQLEKDILSNKDFDGLEIVTAKKQALVDALNALDAERQQLLHESGYNSDSAGIEDFIHALPPPYRQRLEGLWRRLLDTVGSCKQQNLVNGSILGMSMRHCAQALAVLCGQDPRDAVYDPRGNAAANSKRQRYVKA